MKEMATSRQGISGMTEAQFGKAWLKMAIEEGHMKTLPKNKKKVTSTNVIVKKRRKEAIKLHKAGVGISDIAHRLGVQRQLIRHDLCVSGVA